MITGLFKALLPALLLLVPTSLDNAGDEKRKIEKKVIVEDGNLIEIEDGEPLIVHSGGRHGFLGVRLIGVTDELRKHYGAPEDAGVLVGRVEPDSPAAKAGIQVGDLITKVDGDEVESSRDLSREIRRKDKGDSVKLEIVRDRSVRELTVTLEERKGSDTERRRFRIEPRGRRMMFRDGDEFPFLDRLDSLRSLQNRLEELDKRMKELEKRLSAR